MPEGKSSPRKAKHSVVLVVLDGWGIDAPGEYNAISLAKTPNFDSLQKQFGVTKLCASGECVGLPPGQMGNSEVGHLTIGSGRIVFQDLMRVYDEINSGRLAKNKTLLSALRRVKKQNKTLHLMGLVSDGGVHSHISHLFSILDIAKENGVSKIVIHAFLDGRDTPPQSGVKFLEDLQNRLDKTGNAKIGTISGRFYAMDRDNRWDRTKLAYDAIVYAEGAKFGEPQKIIGESYEKGVNDEFVIPVVNASYNGIENGDLLLFFNFRPDRARQLTRALTFTARDFKKLFDRKETKRPKKIEMLSMTVHDPKFKGVKALLGREHVPDTLSVVLEKHNIRQLHVAETEKYAHVTYFFNGLAEKPRRFEDRILIPSLKVGTYDLAPEMSAKGIAAEIVKAINSRKYGFILVNFANADMVGHSGKVPPTVKAVETVDQCLGLIVEAWKQRPEDLTLMVTADHGNAEKLFNPESGQPHTAHTSNPVPFIVVSKKWKASGKNEPGLIDVAPSVLMAMEITKPNAMSGRPLIEKMA